MSRIEKDILGEIEINDNIYYGINTARAIKNFPFSTKTVNLKLIKSLAVVKKAAVETNYELGFIEKKEFDAIIQSCDEIINGKLSDQFPISAMQGGAGTSLNMNINEVIANRSLEILNFQKGDYKKIHPIETINLHQSTNDTYPTALRIAVIKELRVLSRIIEELQGVLQEKEKEFDSILTIARTEMQDAVPITLGMQFASFAEAIARDRWRIFKSEERIRTVNIGGTAAGTGLSAPREFIFLIIEKLRTATGLGIARAEFLMDATANNDAFVEISGMISANATNLIKIAKDLRFLHYQREIKLPANQIGSSIMPGKINPVIIEAVISSSSKVISLDSLITNLVSMGTLQINEYLPLIADSILESLELLQTSNRIFADHIKMISASKDICEEKLNNNLMLITAFVPIIGYKKSEELLQKFRDSADNQNFKDFLICELGLEIVEEILSPSNLTSLGYRKN